MALQWSSETFVAELKDLQANAMAVDCLGTQAVLAGKKTLAYVNLENSEEGDDGSNVTRVARQSKWDVNCIQFNPHASHAPLYVTACNTRLDVCQLSDRNGNPVCTLKAHSRIICDVDWSPFDVNVVASCSVDSFTYLWDIREPKKPVHSFQTVAGAYQVKWNKVTNNLFATTHEGDIRIWDPRKGNSPQQYIAAHLSKIHGLDWSPDNQNQFVTASQDGYVKLWDYTNPKKCFGSTDSGAPVRRARYTPFGAGLVTVVVPQLKRGENSLYLWKITKQSDMSPVHTFVGHKDVVLEFQWRKQPEGSRDQQLVTWSRDQSLRIWRIDPNLQRLCGHDGGDSGEVDLTGTSYNSSESTLKDLRDLSLSEPTMEDEMEISVATVTMAQQARSLQQEFSQLNTDIPNITLDQMDPVSRTCRVTGVGGGQKVIMECLFPEAYPNNVSPSFQILTTTLDAAMQSRLLKVLSDTSVKFVRRNNNCLEMCLRQLMSILDSMDDRRSPESEASFTRAPPPIVQATAFNILPMYSLGNFQDSSVPFPRTSGARFSSNGFLVAFGVPAEMKKVSGGAEITPKALSELAAFTQTSWNNTRTNPFSLVFSRSPPTPSSDMSISDFFEKKGRQRSSRHSHSHSLSRRPKRQERYGEKLSSKKQLSVGKVKIYDVEVLVGVNKYLAQHYKMDLDDVEGTCRHNQSAAAAIGRKDLVQTWSIAATMASRKVLPSPVPQMEMPWAMTPCGRPLLKYILDQHGAQFDVQTLAMLCCLFWTPDPPRPRARSQAQVPRSGSKVSLEFTPPNYNPYHTVSSVTGLLKGLRTRHMRMSTFEGGGSQSAYEAAVAKSKRSMSWSDTFDTADDGRSSNGLESQEELEKLQHEDNCKMLDPAVWEQYDRYKLAYAKILYNWRLFNQRALVLKFISTPVPQHKGVEFAVCCHKCGKEMRGPQCSWCKYPALQCSICHIGVRGLANFCLVCGHGGHTVHILEWFKSHSVCPTGCGCNCLKENLFGG
ncbi:GATOR2 complex protein WDR59-like isoform X3 [Littorina saxatilis]|uniref:GATOR2 complex protein WDR59-like isoform X3 n=1 Tax=Littorina saxatilis TaxID=31220 RepID=UPI0038B4F9D6